MPPRFVNNLLKFLRSYHTSSLSRESSMTEVSKNSALCELVDFRLLHADHQLIDSLLRLLAIEQDVI